MRIVSICFRTLAAFGFIAIGTVHFLSPTGFLTIVPGYLPCPLALVYISGFFEILGGLGLLISRVRRWAAWGLIALLIAVFPANIQMALYNLPVFGETYPVFRWWRLPLQFVLIGWVWLYTRKEPESLNEK